MKRIAMLAFLLLMYLATDAHVGSPGVTFEGKAGPYAIMVLVTPPDVIPGTATVDIYIQESITGIQLKPIYWYAGNEGTPQADVALPVPNEPGHFRGVIWLMSSGTSSIDVRITGARGEGTLLVPVMAVSSVKKQMSAGLGLALAALGIFLLVLMITIIAASVSDGLVTPGGDVTSLRRKRMVGAGVSCVILFLIMWGGKSWWDGLNASYNQYLYRPFNATSTIEERSDGQRLIFRIDSAKLSTLRFTRRLSYLVPDHGKLMHMFIVRAGSLDAFAHLHPRRIDTLTFEVALPKMPAGKYLVFADITSKSGFAETIQSTLEIQANEHYAVTASLSADKDDTSYITNPVGSSEAVSGRVDNIVICGKPGARSVLPDGSTAIWEQVPGNKLEAGKLYSLAFEIMNPDGTPAKLEPYLGMMGHAVVLKQDGSVYIHLHPTGSFSMASQQTLAERFQQTSGPVVWSSLQKPMAFADSINNVIATLDRMPDEQRNMLLSPGMIHNSSHNGHAVVEFPYAFPSSGNYRIWIQMKRDGKIINSAFDAVVE